MIRRLSILTVSLALAILIGSGSRILGACGPFTDITSFCSFVIEIFYLGITTGTTPTTYDPAASVTRLQMAAFLSRTVDSVSTRGSIRTALEQNWTTKSINAVAVTNLGGLAAFVQFDGTDLWVTDFNGGKVNRVRAGDGKLLETWTGAPLAYPLRIAAGRVVVASDSNPGNLYSIDPSQPPGAATVVATNLGNSPQALGYDGVRLWSTQIGSVSIVTPTSSLPWTVTTVFGFSGLVGTVFDGANIWVADKLGGVVHKLDTTGAVLMTVTAGLHPQYPVFDGTNIWVPNSNEASMTVFRASTGTVLATLSGNGLAGPIFAAFDGERVMNLNFSTNSVSVWKASTLAPLGNVPLGGANIPMAACSDGVNFWITLVSGKLARFQ